MYVLDTNAFYYGRMIYLMQSFFVIYKTNIC